MTVVYTYAASDNSRNRRKERRAAQREANQVLVTIPVSRVTKACISVPARSTERPSTDNICLPEVAAFAAGYRKSDVITAR
ncbi:hypothetical protein [Yersinia enterocolitica]|uniref:transcriptional antitermination N peptide n=1 Tax=Yersinia enterocolitica TaxID=630 RepID=UPI0005AD42A8|nr:hypothetical protein [Yersinia enterocolitica]AJJ24892.1 hypothetical protein CH49_1773 [Yersinia enterocolitica]HDL6628081.1 hypothetical protein [Yersinia enterocolitica]HDL6654028.1 hypothetical protein [Yersinia enterocolitica]HDL6680145.1 hypothetical protein [Yersinia enterocolitica]HDL8280403.1 hypothetical protein [Yersinia enterocolitica]